MSHVVSARTLIVSLAGTLMLAATAQAQTTWYVDDDASLGGDGTSWPTAFKYLQDALEVAASADEIRVGGGTYEPDQDEDDPNTVTAGDREATFQFVNAVGLYGGYAGLSDLNNPDNRDIGLYESRLSGDLNGDRVVDLADLATLLAKSLTMPTDARIRLDKHEAGTPVRPKPRQPNPENPITVTHARALQPAMESANPVAERRVLGSDHRAG